MAHKKAGGSVKNNRDSRSKRLGVKTFGSEVVSPGMVIVRQRGTKFHPGKNVKRGADDTLLSLVSGSVKFSEKKVRAFNGNLVKRRYIEVIEDISDLDLVA